MASHDKIDFDTPKDTGETRVLTSESHNEKLLTKLAKADIGEYQFLETVGSGAFGTVWKAWDRLLLRYVAIKVVRFADSSDINELLREAQTAAKLNHPNIVRTLGVKTEDGCVFHISELIRGQNLLDHMRSCKLTFAESAKVCFQIANGLHHAHSLGVIHRDVKPSNILVDHDGHAILSDFGIAKVESANLTVRKGEQFVGSIGYMSPEQSRSEPVDARSDVYSLGVVLYELLAGKSPFSGTPQDILVGHRYVPAKPLRSLDCTIPRDLETICNKAIEKRPHERYHSAERFAEDLQRYLKGQPIAAKPLSIRRRVVRTLNESSRSRIFQGVILSLLTLAVYRYLFAASTASRAGLRQVNISTYPEGSMISAFPIDAFGQADQSRKAKLSVVTTPTTLFLEPGKYRILATKRGFPIAEVDRYVPREDEKIALGLEKINYWATEGNAIKWFRIPLVDKLPADQMVLIPGKSGISSFYLSAKEINTSQIRIENESDSIKRNTSPGSTDCYSCSHILATYYAEELGTRLPTMREISMAIDFLTQLSDVGELNLQQAELLKSLKDDVSEWTSSISSFQSPRKCQVICFRGNGLKIEEFLAQNDVTPKSTPLCFRVARTAQIPQSSR